MARAHAESRQDPIIVAGVGAVSAVGHSASVSYTSVRARLARIGQSTDLRIRDDRGKLMSVTCAPVVGITDGQRRYLRHYRMAVRALADVLSSGTLDTDLLVHADWFLALAEPERPGWDDRVKSQMVRRMARDLDIPDPSSRTIFTSTGHAGAFEAVEAAGRAIEAGRCSRALVGGVDSYLDELTLQWLKDTGRLKTDDHPVGFVPGEASAFVLLERQSISEERGLRGLAQVAGVGNAIEANSIYEERTPCTGEGLTNAIRLALETGGGPASPVALAVCDLNGERYRANEWGLAMARAFSSVSLPAVLWHPADCLGDCGAAAGVLNLVFGTMALARHAVGEGGVLVWGSGDDGQRGACLLAPATLRRRG